MITTYPISENFPVYCNDIIIATAFVKEARVDNYHSNGSFSYQKTKRKVLLDFYPSNKLSNEQECLFQAFIEKHDGFWFDYGSKIILDIPRKDIFRIWFNRELKRLRLNFPSDSL